MNIEQITRRVSDYEARENIHQQFLKEILILGEREGFNSQPPEGGWPA